MTARKAFKRSLDEQFLVGAAIFGLLCIGFGVIGWLLYAFH